MSLEITLSAGLAYQDANGVSLELLAEALQFSVTTKVVERGPQSIAITETPIELGSVVAVGWLIFKNLDATNFVTLKNAASGQRIAILKPAGGLYIAYAGPNAQAMVAIADTAACIIDKLICSQ